MLIPMPKRIYLDYNATAPLAPEVAAAITPWLTARPANPSSVHADGRAARAAVEQAREHVAALLDPAAEVVFTSGGTEADNLAVHGCLGWPPAGHVVISAVEHPAVAEPAEHLELVGVGVSVVPVDGDGRIDLTALAQALRPETRLVSVMAANNEVGTLQPIAQICEMAHAHGTPLHCDAVQAAAWCALPELLGDVDMVSLSGHKIGGPPGIGALILRRGIHLEPQLLGGGQQKARRPGTEPTALIVGLGAAAARVEARRETESARIAGLSLQLAEAVLGRCPDARLTVSAPRLPNTVHFCFHECAGDALVARLDLDGVAVSSGSACHSGATHVSPVLRAMDVEAEAAAGALRVSLGYDTEPEEIETAATRIAAAASAVRQAAVGASLP